MFQKFKAKKATLSILLSIVLFPLHSRADVIVGLGTSSFTYGRVVPSLNLGLTSESWNFEFQSEGVQTTVYSQNAWTIAGYQTFQEDQFGFGKASIGAGLGYTYILRGYRDSPTAETSTVTDNVIGPYLSARFTVGFFYIGFNTLLGLSPKVQQHILLNFKDISHITLGVSL